MRTSMRTPHVQIHASTHISDLTLNNASSERVAHTVECVGCVLSCVAYPELEPCAAMLFIVITMQNVTAARAPAVFGTRKEAAAPTSP